MATASDQKSAGKVAVFSASGRQGRLIVDHVLSQGYAPGDVVAITRKPDKLTDLAKLGVDVRKGDMDDKTSMPSAFKGVTHLLLIPTISPLAQRCAQYSDSLAAAREAGVAHISHLGVIGWNPEQPWHVTPFLAYAEAAVRHSGMHWTVFRMGFYAEPIAEWAPEIVKMGTIPYPSGQGKHAYVSRIDIARTVATVLCAPSAAHHGKTYHLLGPKAVNNAELCAAIAEVTGKTVVDKQATDDDYRKACQGTQPDFLTDILLDIYKFVREGHAAVEASDILDITGKPPQSFLQVAQRVLKDVKFQ